MQVTAVHVLYTAGTDRCGKRIRLLVMQYTVQIKGTGYTRDPHRELIMTQQTVSTLRLNLQL